MSLTLGKHCFIVDHYLKTSSYAKLMTNLIQEEIPNKKAAFEDDGMKFSDEISRNRQYNGQATKGEGLMCLQESKNILCVICKNRKCCKDDL